MPDINVTVKCANDQKYTISIDTEKTVLEFKGAIAEKSQTPAERQRLIYSGRVLRDDEVLSTYKIQDGHTVHMVKGAAGTSNNASTSSSGSSSTANNLPTNMQAGQPVNNPFAALGAGAFPGGFNPFTMFGGTGGPSGPAMDPNAIANMFGNPQFAQTMSSMLSNPQVLDSIINMNPQLRAMGPEVRQMMQSEEFRRAMSDPNTLRAMAQMSAAMGQLRGGGGMLGSNNPSFPAPGATDTTPPTSTASTNANTTDTSTTTPPSTDVPFNPFASLLNPTAVGAGAAAAAGTGTGTAPGMFDPALFETYMRTMAGVSVGDLTAGGTGAGTTATTNLPSDTRPPEVRYETQLRQLNEMGFWDPQQNIRALQMTGGNVNAAIEYLLNNAQ